MTAVNDIAVPKRFDLFLLWFCVFFRNSTPFLTRFLVREKMY